MSREPSAQAVEPSLAVTHPPSTPSVVLLAALYLLPLATGFPLLDPDEGLHAAITQEMVARGDYVMPRFLGEPFLDKPILFFWAQAAAFRAFGEHEAAARVPGLLFGALGALSTGWVAATILGPGGWVAALLYTTLLVPMALMQVPVHDIALVPFTNAALLAFWRAARAPRAGDEPRRGPRPRAWRSGSPSSPRDSRASPSWAWPTPPCWSSNAV